jgi:hypothetical protein
MANPAERTQDTEPAGALPYTPDEIMTRPFEWPEP